MHLSQEKKRLKNAVFWQNLYQKFPIFSFFRTGQRGLTNWSYVMCFFSSTPLSGVDSGTLMIRWRGWRKARVPFVRLGYLSLTWSLHLALPPVWVFWVACSLLRTSCGQGKGRIFYGDKIIAMGCLRKTTRCILIILSQRNNESPFKAQLPWLWEHKGKEREIPKKEREKEERRDFMTY